MALFNFTQEDVAGTTILQPTWYPLEVTRADEGVSKAGNNMITVFFKCIGANEADGSPMSPDKIKNIRVKPANFVTDGAGRKFAVPFVKALGATLGAEGGQVELKPEALIGKKVRGFIKNTIWEGRTQNEVVDYQPF